MKNFKVVNQNKNISREFVSKIGESIYHTSDVRAVLIQIDFKDGSSVRFARSEEEDEEERDIKKERGEKN